MPDFKTSCTLIMTQISVSFTGDFRLDLMLVSAIVWVMIRTKRVNSPRPETLPPNLSISARKKDYGESRRGPRKWFRNDKASAQHWPSLFT